MKNEFSIEGETYLKIESFKFYCPNYGSVQILHKCVRRGTETAYASRAK